MEVIRDVLSEDTTAELTDALNTMSVYLLGRAYHMQPPLILLKKPLLVERAKQEFVTATGSPPDRTTVAIHQYNKTRAAYSTDIHTDGLNPVMVAVSSRPDLNPNTAFVVDTSNPASLLALRSILNRRDANSESGINYEYNDSGVLVPKPTSYLPNVVQAPHRSSPEFDSSIPHFAPPMPPGTLRLVLTCVNR